MTTIVSIKNIDLDISFITYQIEDRGREFSKRQTWAVQIPPKTGIIYMCTYCKKNIYTNAK